MKTVFVHLISDSSGQTVQNAARSTLLQFPNIKAKQYKWPLVRNERLLSEVLEKISAKPGIVLYTISNAELREKLKNFCRQLKIPCISVIGKIIKEASAFWGIDSGKATGFGNYFDASYFDKLDAIDYSIRHDDGQGINNLNDADIIIIGPSRTSKTPTSIYLAYNGFKTANIPFVNTPSNLATSKYLGNISYPTLIVGLIINPTRLIQIREARIEMMQLNNILLSNSNNYTDIKTVQEECLQVKRICAQQSWPIIDVSRKSIEETAAEIMKLYYERRKGKFES